MKDPERDKFKAIIGLLLGVITAIAFSIGRDNCISTSWNNIQLFLFVLVLSVLWISIRLEQEHLERQRKFDDELRRKYDREHDDEELEEEED